MENWDISRRSGTDDRIKRDSFTYLFTSIDTTDRHVASEIRPPMFCHLLHWSWFWWERICPTYFCFYVLPFRCLPPSSNFGDERVKSMHKCPVEVEDPECARGGGEATFWLKKGVLASLYWRKCMKMQYFHQKGGGRTPGRPTPYAGSATALFWHVVRLRHQISWRKGWINAWTKRPIVLSRSVTLIVWTPLVCIYRPSDSGIADLLFKKILKRSLNAPNV